LDAQTQNDVNDIRRGIKTIDRRGNLVALPSPNYLPAEDQEKALPGIASPIATGVIDIAQRELLAAEMERTVNIRRIVRYAEEIAHRMPDEQVSDDAVDPDWFMHWRRRAAEVSSDVMQHLWAKILSDEAARPGSIAVHTLETLCRLSKADAKLIASLQPYAFNNRWLFRVGKKTAIGRLTYSKLLKLEEIGVIQGAQSLKIKQNFNKPPKNDFEKIIYIDEKAILFTCNKIISLGIIKITQVGSELLSLGSSPPEGVYFEYVARLLKQKGCRVWLGNWSVSGGDEGVITGKAELIDTGNDVVNNDIA
jgi:hypothetical protein